MEYWVSNTKSREVNFLESFLGNFRWQIVPWYFPDISPICTEIPDLSMTSVKFLDISRFFRQNWSPWFLELELEWSDWLIDWRTGKLVVDCNGVVVAPAAKKYRDAERLWATSSRLCALNDARSTATEPVPETALWFYFVVAIFLVTHRGP